MMKMRAKVSEEVSMSTNNNNYYYYYLLMWLFFICFFCIEVKYVFRWINTIIIIILVVICQDHLIVVLLVFEDAAFLFLNDLSILNN